MAATPDLSHPPAVRVGADRLLAEYVDLIRGKRVGILTNHTGRLTDGRHVVDAIAESGIASVVALFGPEHGISGDTPDGKVVDHGMHPRHGVPVFSLYGRTHKPTAEMLRGVEVLVCDIQDVGVRFYTFISTIALAVEAAAEQQITCVILDRPNPIRGICFDGPVRVDSLKSFVGWMPIPVMHGMTVGELVRMWNGERQFAGGVTARLEVVPMEHWTRSMWFDQTNLPWVAPSPNMQRLSTAIVYPGMCFIEGTSASEGRGTPWPFELIGAPWMDPERVMCHLADFTVPGVLVAAEEFTPREIPGTAAEPKYEGKKCRGLRLTVQERDAVRPVGLGIAMLAAIKRAHPADMELRDRRFDILTGSQLVRKKLERGMHPDEICAGWKDELEEFGRMRGKYLFYPI